MKKTYFGIAGFLFEIYSLLKIELGKQAVFGYTAVHDFFVNKTGNAKYILADENENDFLIFFL